MPFPPQVELPSSGRAAYHDPEAIDFLLGELSISDNEDLRYRDRDRSRNVSGGTGDSGVRKEPRTPHPPGRFSVPGSQGSRGRGPALSGNARDESQNSPTPSAEKHKIRFLDRLAGDKGEQRAADQPQPRTSESHQAIPQSLASQPSPQPDRSSPNSHLQQEAPVQPPAVQLSIAALSDSGTTPTGAPSTRLSSNFLKPLEPSAWASTVVGPFLVQQSGIDTFNRVPWNPSQQLQPVPSPKRDLTAFSSAPYPSYGVTHQAPPAPSFVVHQQRTPQHHESAQQVWPQYVQTVSHPQNTQYQSGIHHQPSPDHQNSLNQFLDFQPSLTTQESASSGPVRVSAPQPSQSQPGTPRPDPSIGQGKAILGRRGLHCEAVTDDPDLRVYKYIVSVRKPHKGVNVWYASESTSAMAHPPMINGQILENGDLYIHLRNLGNGGEKKRLVWLRENSQWRPITDEHTVHCPWDASRFLNFSSDGRPSWNLSKPK
ncbi:hypothetical protein FPV67DRAFT_1452764 [Lyophyllum atratum]|nr:hypothetical protein FPV67DRAFT_1454688 [Lyophyllum atratum]KAF8060669.1 hypothetical protein FPV67DRAFT_1452764 [Lyophyllum atratum]